LISLEEHLLGVFAEELGALAGSMNEYILMEAVESTASCS
jgi:hypothetical protein